jgi:DDE superfamily endonuclease
VVVHPGAFRGTHLGTTNLFAALNVTTREVFGECKPVRDGANFLAFLKKAVKPHADSEVHVVLDNVSAHTTPEVIAWLERNPHVHFHFTPVGSSWINQIEPGSASSPARRLGVALHLGRSPNQADPHRIGLRRPVQTSHAAGLGGRGFFWFSHAMASNGPAERLGVLRAAEGWNPTDINPSA